MVMVTASLLLNIIVLIPVCIALLVNYKHMEFAAGIFTPARGILLAMYLTILTASFALLFFTDFKLAFGLFVMQIVYKVLSPFTVKSIKNPIVICNVLIAAFHLVTVYSMIQADDIQFQIQP
jgi:hypothetical protein